MQTSLTRSYELCAQVARQSSSSFYYSFFLLSREKRRAMCALYAFLRKTDDLSDNPRPLDQRRADLAHWREALQEALDNKFEGANVRQTPIFPALVDTVVRHHIPHEYLFEVIDGVAMDLEQVRFATFAELERYCYKVASAVGLACIHIWGFRDSTALAAATSCGVAFQLTNILRDLKQDASIGRVYLPEEDIASAGYSRDELLQGNYNCQFRALVDLEIERSIQYYQAGAALENYLMPDGRRIFGAMYSTYYQLLCEVDARREDLLRGEVRVARWRRACIAARWLLLPASLEFRALDGQGASRR